MKTNYLLLIIALLSIFISCQNNSSNTSKSGNDSTNTSSEYAIMFVISPVYLTHALAKPQIRIYYGNDKSEDFTISTANNSDKKNSGSFIDIEEYKNNDVVNALDYMSNKGYELIDFTSSSDMMASKYIFKKE